MTPNHYVLFTITAESINEMLQLQTGQKMTPLSVVNLLNIFATLTSIKLAQLFHTFIREEQYIPKDAPRYMLTIFSDLRQDIIEMTSSVLDQTISEFVDEIIIAFMSIYTPGKPLAIMFDSSKFIAYKMHDQFMRMDNERVFKYSSILYHLFLYYKADKFTFTLQKLDTRGNPRLVVLWTSLIHIYDSSYSYTDFIDLFVHLVATMLLGSPPPKISANIRRVLQLSKQYRVGD